MSTWDTTSLSEFNRQSNQNIDIEAVLSAKLSELRQKSPERFLKSTYVLAAVDSDIEGEWEQRLQQAMKHHTEGRIVLIPYKAKNLHWIGIVLEFQADEQLLKAQFIDPVNFSSFTPDKLQKIFARYFPRHVLQSKALLKVEDPARSATLTIANLLTAAENFESLNRASPKSNQSQSTFNDDRQVTSNIVEEEQQICWNQQQVDDTSTSNTHFEGKQFQQFENEEISDNISIPSSSLLMSESHDKYTLHQLKQKLTDDLIQSRIQDLNELPKRIQRTEQRVKDFQDENRDEDVDKEMQLLMKYRSLQSLSEQIASLEAASSTDDNSNELKLYQLQESLKNGLEKMKIMDVKQLSDRITRAEGRIKDYEEENRDEDAKKEIQILSELKKLQKIAAEIAELEREMKSDARKLRKLEKLVKDGLEKLKISDMTKLSGMILKAEQRIQDYQEEGRDEDAQVEIQRLMQLKDLASVAQQIVSLKTASLVPENHDESKLNQLREILSKELEKLKIQNVKQLSERITRTEKRINDDRIDGRDDDAAKEEKILMELQGLQKIAEEIGKLEHIWNSDEAKLERLEKTLNDCLKKQRISDVTKLAGMIQRSEERIKDYLEDRRDDDAEKEEKNLIELQEIQKIVQEISKLEPDTIRNNSKLRQLEKSLNDRLQKLKISDVPKLLAMIQRSEERINGYLEDRREEDADKEKQRLMEYRELESLVNEIAKLKSSQIESQPSSQANNNKINEDVRASTKVDPIEQKNEHDSDAERVESFQTESNTSSSLTKSSVPSNSASTNENVVLLSNDDVNSNLSQETDDSSRVVGSDKFAEEKQRIELQDLCNDLADLPDCAERTVMELLVNMQKRMIDKTKSSNEQQFASLEHLERLKNQLNREDFWSEQMRTSLQSLERAFECDDCSMTTSILGDLLKKIRPLNVHEIKRLVIKTETVADLIRDQDIVLLIGVTGSGKSTTIQFLAGEKMKATKVKIAERRFLDHIEIDGLPQNPQLKPIISSPLSKSETRFISNVTVSLQKVLGAHESGDIILCDAPGFGDTEGPEVDIANGVGVIEALRRCKSVKILALSSYNSLGDRGEGIQKLAHILINMMQGIETRLNSIVYAFTKYPPSKDINALLLGIKNTKVDKDASLRMDTGFVTVLADMIEKTENSTYLINPLGNYPKKLIEKLKNLRGIAYPGEVFRFSMSEETQANIVNHVQRDKLSIINAIKCKDIELIMYYLNNLKTLQDLTKQSTVRDAYEHSIRVVSESIDEYCAEIMKRFSRALASQVGLREEDIGDYKTAIAYLQQSQKLRKHLESKLPLPAALLESIDAELHKKDRTLINEDLHDHSVGIFLDNFRMLSDSFQELECKYNKICKQFAERFEELVQSAHEPIFANEFQEVAEILLKIFKSSQILKHHLDYQTEEKYRNTVKFLLEHLNSFSAKANPRLEKMQLNEDDLNMLRACMEILKAAKENSALQDRIFTYAKMFEKNNDSIEERIITYSSETIFYDLNEIYNSFISKIVSYFDKMDMRVKELLEKSKEHALENIEKLIGDMDKIRIIPELESRTAASYYRTVEHVRGFMQQLQRETEQLLLTVENQSGTIDYARHAKALLRLKNAEWMNRVSPGAYDTLIRHIAEELVQYAQQLETRLKKLDYGLKYPDNISVAYEIVQNIESMSNLERIVPDLKEYKKNILQRFLDTTQATFDRIQKAFNLQDKHLYQVKQELKELEQIKRDYEALHPANIYLRTKEYSNIQVLNRKIEDLKTKKDEEMKLLEDEIHQIKSQVDDLNLIVKQYMKLSADVSSNQQGMIQAVAKVAQNMLQGNVVAQDRYLKELGYVNINTVYESIAGNQKQMEQKQRLMCEKREEFNRSIHYLLSIKEEYESLLVSRDMISLEEMSFLREKDQESFEKLEDVIQEKRRNIAQREKNKQTYDFSGRLDAATANNALLYISKCEQIDHERVRETAADTNIVLQKYISEYGNFLYEEIRRTFKDVISISPDADPSQHSYNLEICLNELSSLSKFKSVYECIDGDEKVKYWYREFIDYHHTLSSKMEQCRVSSNNRELRHQLAIAQVLSCVDRCVDRLAGNGFGALYRQYQVEVTKDAKEAYKVVLNHIIKGDYASADMALSDINDRPLYERDLKQIKHDLRTSLNKLMKDTKSIANWLDGKIEREEDNRNQITILKDNIDKVRTALNKQGIMNLLDQETQNDLHSFDSDINEQLTSIILKGLQCIQDCMDGNNFSEAEQGIERLNHVQRELVGYFTTSKVTDKTGELRKNLDKIVGEISKCYETANIDSYTANPPKDLLTKLKQVASRGGTRYNQAYTTIIANIQKHFSEAIENIRKLPASERPARMRQLNYALCFIPEDMQVQFKLQIDALNQLLMDQEAIERRTLHSTLESGNDDDQTITKIGALAKQYSEDKHYELFEKLRQLVLKKLHVHRTNVENFLDKQDMQSALDTVKKIFKYREVLISSITEVEAIYTSVCDSIVKSFKIYSETLANISIIEQSQIIENAFSNIIACLNFSSTFDGKVQNLLSESAVRKGNEECQKMAEYFCQISEKFQLAIEEMNIPDLHKIMIISKRWNNFLRKIKQSQIRHGLIQTLLSKMATVISYDDMITQLQYELDRLQKQLNVELISDETARFETERKKFFDQLMKSINILRNVNAKFKDLLPSVLDIDKLEEDLKAKVRKLRDQLFAIASRSELSSRDADSFRLYYNHILAFDNHISLPGFTARRFLKESEEKIFGKVSSLVEEITSSTSNIQKVAETLIKIKFLAENLSMFDSIINTDIDKALKVYKSKEGTAGIMNLTMALEKTDVGSRIISEHACLAGEDWRKRREKMQNQDNLDYVLKELKGDDLSLDVLRARYKTFREKYDKLVSTVLSTWNQKTGAEPNLDALIFQTKHLAGTLTKTTDSITWDQTLKDSLPELLANIFAVWTLKNTQHYNSMRGIESAQAYLLMPHVAQLIAIFRILGLGYEISMKSIGRMVPLSGKISDDLVNNLVEVGTGEGKSVIMAVTACVFALIGADVNCSCYSEVLSMRDKNDFAAVFRALGIEERIEYGTFNKLCENLLNEQCNIREKVRDMIINNKNALDVAGVTKRARPKILLIDEVDVFLSEKFYGGMYTPSLHLKDPLIKTLLDTLWTNRTVRNLNTIKTMPAYVSCAAKFSHWMFLFDEALKDMLAALQSFQSSTYIVQNDKIVYVEGESIAENVVRGYDTIWAYYHEHAEKNITQSSLEANVGIILNCGTFSYAEMPHEFAYTTGVTGTLSTLASTEKNILKQVYSVHKNTFLPSVFGKSNRIYDPASDIIVVDESEYFMKIRGEIDIVCNARRAILVFFESEEKLMQFYNSPQLSSKKNDVQIMTEKVSIKDRELYIKRAATIDAVTLLTKTFGRGTDFICRNQQLLLNGGVHVLQAFFSEELSEQYQIMGRGARQGDKGSYRMILLDKDLEWVLGSAWKNELEKIPKPQLYKNLNEARNALYESKCGAKELGIEQCKCKHTASKAFMNVLSAGQMNEVKKFLLEQNKGVNLITGCSRTVLLMDATGSMSSLLIAAKETVCTMFERAAIILNEKSLPSDAFQMQFVVYRDYDCKVRGLLQSSPWETKPSNLRNFMATIHAKGGGDYEEAIEIGLWHAVQESMHPVGISQVILIGDAPAKDTAAINRDRASSGGESYWAKTKYNVPTHFTTELKKLKKKNIPVHAFYLHAGARDNFQKIAGETKGRCEQLIINSSQGAELLTSFVTEEVLRKTAGDQGDAVVELYRKKYVKTTFTS